MFQKDNLHHATLIEGSKKLVLEELHAFFHEKLHYPIQGNPDYWFQEFDSIGVDDARAISALQQKRSAMGNKKLFIIVFNSITREAQNALLKVFEEPTEDTHFFLITPSMSALLPTLKSRMNSLSFHSSLHSSISSQTKKFMSGTPADRIKLVKKMVESETPKADALVMLSEIECLMQEEVLKGTVKSEYISEIYTVKSYLHDTSASVKMLLEHLSLILPKI